MNPKGCNIGVLRTGEFREPLPNWQVRAHSSVLIKPSFFLRKGLILRQAGKHAAAAVDRAAEWRKLSQFQPHTPLLLCLWLQAWQTHGCLTPRRGLASHYVHCAYVSEWAWELLRYYVYEWPMYNTFVCVHVQACVCDISMTTKSPRLPLGTQCWQRESSTQRQLCVCVCVANVLTLCRVHVLEAAAPVGISTGVACCIERYRPLWLRVSVAHTCLSRLFHSVTYRFVFCTNQSGFSAWYHCRMLKKTFVFHFKFISKRSFRDNVKTKQHATVLTLLTCQYEAGMMFSITC